MENKELNELKMMLKKIESMELSSKKDASNIKSAMMNLLKKIAIKYQTLSLEKQNNDINSVIPEIVSVFAKIQGLSHFQDLGSKLVSCLTFPVCDMADECFKCY